MPHSHRYRTLPQSPRGPSLKDTLAKVIRSKGYQAAIDGGIDIPGSRVAIL